MARVMENISPIKIWPKKYFVSSFYDDNCIYLIEKNYNDIVLLYIVSFKLTLQANKVDIIKRFDCKRIETSWRQIDEDANVYSGSQCLLRHNWTWIASLG